MDHRTVQRVLMLMLFAGLIVSYQNGGQKELRWQLQVRNLGGEEKGVVVGTINIICCNIIYFIYN